MEMLKNNEKKYKFKNSVNIKELLTQDIQINTDNKTINSIIHNIENIKFDKNMVISLFIVLISVIMPLVPSNINIISWVDKLYIEYAITLITILIMIGLNIRNLICRKKENLVNNVQNSENITKQKKLFSKINIEFTDFIIIIYSILILLSTFFSEYFPTNLFNISYGRAEGTITLFWYILLFYIAYKAFDFKEYFLKCLATSSIIISIIAISQAIMGSINGNLKEGISIYFGNSNFFSSYICLVLPIYIIMYLKKGEKLYLAASFLTFSSLIFANSLGGYITFGLYFFIILLESIINKNSKKRLGILILFLLISYIMSNIITGNFSIKVISKAKAESNKIIQIMAKSNATTANNNNNNDNNNQSNDVINIFNSLGTGRGFIFRLSFDIIKKHLLLGVGPDSLGSEIHKYYYLMPGYTSRYFFDKAHSEYLQIAVCTGIPSVICYITLVAIIGIKMLINFCKNKDKYIIFAIGMGLFSYLFQASANISVVQVAPIFWIMLGIGYSLVKRKRFYIIEM